MKFDCRGDGRKVKAGDIGLKQMTSFFLFLGKFCGEVSTVPAGGENFRKISTGPTGLNSANYVSVRECCSAATARIYRMASTSLRPWTVRDWSLATGEQPTKIELIGRCVIILMIQDTRSWSGRICFALHFLSHVSTCPGDPSRACPPRATTTPPRSSARENYRQTRSSKKEGHFETEKIPLDNR